MVTTAVRCTHDLRTVGRNKTFFVKAANTVACVLFVLFSILAVYSTADADTTAGMPGFTLYGKGPEKVLVMHDWMGDSENYRTMMRYLDTYRFTYAFIDVRGYGISKHLGGPYTVQQVSQDAFAVADRLGWQRFHVVGHSMTGMVVQWMALKDWSQPGSGKRLKSVIAITPVSADGYPATPEDLEFFNAVIFNEEMSQKAFAGLTGARLSPRWGYVKTIRHLETASREALLGYLEMWVNTDISKKIAQANIQTPLLVIGGRQDMPGFQESHFQKTYAQWYPNVTIKYITDAGHYPMQETPVYLASLIEDFLAKKSEQLTQDNPQPKEGGRKHE